MPPELDRHEHAEPLGQLAAGEAGIERLLTQPRQGFLEPRILEVQACSERASAPVSVAARNLVALGASEAASHQPDRPARSLCKEMDIGRGEDDVADLTQPSGAAFHGE